MPRARKPPGSPGPGGTRVGTPGTAYPNRTDLSGQKSLPARAATGQTYGKAQQQLQAQRTVPMAPAPSIIPARGAVTGQSQAPLSGTQAPPVAQQGGPPPGSAGPLARPSERPGEPVTSGIRTGPGPGPEALPQGPANPTENRLSDTLAQVARVSGSSALQALAAKAAAAGQ